MKIKMRNYGTEFDLRCPRCGNTEWSEEIFVSCRHAYHKCMHCGADVATDEETKIDIVIERPFSEFTPQTYDEIKGENGIKSYGWA